MKTRLIIVRHAEAEGNFKRLFHGWTDSEITQKGHAQAELLSERMCDVEIDILYSSSLYRTRQTAEYISKAKSLSIKLSDKLKEINGGDWENQPWDTLPGKWPVEYEAWEKAPHLVKLPNGESMVEFQLRLIDEIKRIIDENLGQNICIVTHGTAIRALLCHFMDYDIKEMTYAPWCDNTSVTIVDFDSDKYDIVTEGDVSHLTNELRTIQNQDWWNDYIKERGNRFMTRQNKQESSSNKLVEWLFETKAFRVSPENKPFWYTSGTIGPYYVNTHFLYGSEEKAENLLKIIDEIKDDKQNCPDKLLTLIKSNYNSDKIFKGLIDEMVLFIKNNIDINSIDYISGGERRDWFFSLIIAEILDIPHITIFKDLSYIIGETGKPMKMVSQINVLHIADLITEASSYEKSWIPAITNFGGTIKWSVVVVDRKQGGGELLEKNNIKSFDMVSIDKSLFERALNMNLINQGQFEMLCEYKDHPKESMKRFIKEHPEFMENSLNSDEKTRARAKLCIEKGFYE